MQYRSTRSEIFENATNTIIKGISDDGGLYVPEWIPQFDLDDIMDLAQLSYAQLCARVMAPYLNEYTKGELESYSSKAYFSFSHPNVAPVRKVGDVHFLELWHGPTLAFKDIALQMLPRLLVGAMQKQGVKEKVLIQVATSGDTGKAALEGFSDVSDTAICVFYPEGGVSPMQKLQMTTQHGHNVHVCAVKGNFDDAQSGVKSLLGSGDFKRLLKRNHWSVSSANSINWGRLVPQIVYYFYAYCQMLGQGLPLGRKINFVVPTGNFGNILAGYYAMRMGLPVNKLICASNANNVLTDFFHTGVYDSNREFMRTISPSMDILISSNLERLLFEVSRDSHRVAAAMHRLKMDGKYDVNYELQTELRRIFTAEYTDDERAKAAIKSVFRKYDYLMDPHTAVAYDVYSRLEDDTPTVIVSTASPYKFCGAVLDALGETRENLDEFGMINRLGMVGDLETPEQLTALKNAEERFSGQTNMQGMASVVLDFVKSMKG